MCIYIYMYCIYIYYNHIYTQYICIHIYIHIQYIHLYDSIRIKREGKTDIKLPPFWNMKCNWMIFSGPSFMSCDIPQESTSGSNLMDVHHSYKVYDTDQYLGEWWQFTDLEKMPNKGWFWGSSQFQSALAMMSQLHFNQNYPKKDIDIQSFTSVFRGLWSPLYPTVTPTHIW